MCVNTRGVKGAGPLNVRNLGTAQQEIQTHCINTAARRSAECLSIPPFSREEVALHPPTYGVLVHICSPSRAIKIRIDYDDLRLFVLDLKYSALNAP